MPLAYAHMATWSGPYDYIGGMTSSFLMTLTFPKPRCHATYIFMSIYAHMPYDHMPIWPYIICP